MPSIDTASLALPAVAGAVSTDTGGSPARHICSEGGLGYSHHAT
jgi:hypothetical protein